MMKPGNISIECGHSFLELWAAEAAGFLQKSMSFFSLGDRLWHPPLLYNAYLWEVTDCVCHFCTWPLTVPMVVSCVFHFPTSRNENIYKERTILCLQMAESLLSLGS